MYSYLGWPPSGMFRASHMFDDSAKSRNPGEIVLSETAGESQQHFPEEAPEIETLRRRVLKIGARIRQTTRRIWVHLSSAFPEQALFHLVLSRLNSS